MRELLGQLSRATLLSYNSLLLAIACESSSIDSRDSGLSELTIQLNNLSKEIVTDPEKHPHVAIYPSSLISDAETIFKKSTILTTQLPDYSSLLRLYQFLNKYYMSLVPIPQQVTPLLPNGTQWVDTINKEFYSEIELGKSILTGIPCIFPPTRVQKLVQATVARTSTQLHEKIQADIGLIRKSMKKNTKKKKLKQLKTKSLKDISTESSVPLLDTSLIKTEEKLGSSLLLEEPTLEKTERPLPPESKTTADPQVEEEAFEVDTHENSDSDYSASDTEIEEEFKSYLDWVNQQRAFQHTATNSTLASSTSSSASSTSSQPKKLHLRGHAANVFKTIMGSRGETESKGPSLKIRHRHLKEFLRAIGGGIVTTIPGSDPRIAIPTYNDDAKNVSVTGRFHFTHNGKEFYTTSSLQHYLRPLIVASGVHNVVEIDPEK